VAQLFDAHLVPLGAIAAAALGVAGGAAVSFGFGTPDVAPTVTEADGFLTQLGVPVTSLVRSDTVSSWGATRFTGTAPDGGMLDGSGVPPSICASVVSTTSSTPPA
jgi:hypothetical protein